MDRIGGIKLDRWFCDFALGKGCTSCEEQNNCCEKISELHFALLFVVRMIYF
jgi:hypothetical protein